MEKRILIIAVVLVFAAFLAHSYESNLQRLTGQQIATFSDDTEEQSFFVEQGQRESYRVSRTTSWITQIGDTIRSLFSMSSSSDNDDDKINPEKLKEGLIHIGEGPDKTKLISEDYKRAESSGGNSGEGPLGGGQHSPYPQTYTQYFGSSDVHNPIPGPDETLYFRGKRHNPIPGPEASRMVWNDFKHNPAPGRDESLNFPPSWKHALSGSHASEMWPPEGPPPDPPKPEEPPKPAAPRPGRPGQRHVQEGPYKTEWRDADWKHIEEGPKKTELVPPDWKHSEEGPKKTELVPPDYKHVEEGPDKTLLVPPDYKHIEEGPAITTWVPPDYKHIEEGPEKTRVVPPYYKHVEEGPDKTGWRYPDEPGKKPDD